MKIRVSAITDEIDVNKLKIKNQTIKNNLQNAYFNQVMKLKNVRGIYCDDKLIGVVVLSVCVTKAKDKLENNEYGAVKLDTLVIDERYRNLGIGTKILNVLINELKEYSNKLGYRFFVLDALSDKSDWYHRRGFESHGKAELENPLITMSVDFADDKLINKYMELNI